MKYVNLGENAKVSCIGIGCMRSAAKAAEIELTKAEWYRLYKAAGNTLP